MDIPAVIQTVMMTIIGLVLVPIGGAIIRLLVVQYGHAMILFGQDGKSGIVQDIKSARRRLTDVEKNCAVHSFADDSSVTDNEANQRLARHLIAAVRQQTSKQQKPSDTPSD